MKPIIKKPDLEGRKISRALKAKIQADFDAKIEALYEGFAQVEEENRRNPRPEVFKSRYQKEINKAAHAAREKARYYENRQKEVVRKRQERAKKSGSPGKISKKVSAPKKGIAVQAPAPKSAPKPKGKKGLSLKPPKGSVPVTPPAGPSPKQPAAPNLRYGNADLGAEPYWVQIPEARKTWQIVQDVLQRGGAQNITIRGEIDIQFPEISWISATRSRIAWVTELNGLYSAMKALGSNLPPLSLSVREEKSEDVIYLYSGDGVGERPDMDDEEDFLEL